MSSSSKKLPVDGYYCEDATAMTQSLPADSIDVTITSPPYGAMKNYGPKGQIGYGQTYEDYLESLRRLFAEIYARTRDSGSLWVVVDTFKERGKVRLLPYDLAALCTREGWLLQDLIIWNKTKTLPWSHKGQFRRIFEYVLFFSKSRSFNFFVDQIKEPDDLKEWWVKYPERYSPEGKVPSTIWTYPIPVQGSWSPSQVRHFCPFPPALVERILLLTTSPGDLVFDPFAGSGTVLAQAKVMDRRYLGSDLNAKYRDHFTKVTSNHLSTRWTNEQESKKKIEGERQQLAATIRKLRQVKYPKTLFKELSRNLEGSHVKEINSIVVKAGESADARFFSRLFIFIISDKYHSALIKEARRVIKKAPLSKFGLSSEISCYSGADFFSAKEGALLKGQPFSIYLEGKTHFSSGEETLTDQSILTTRRWKRIPPIFIDIDVRQVPVKTWQTQNGKQSH